MGYDYRVGGSGFLPQHTRTDEIKTSTWFEGKKLDGLHFIVNDE
jgi:hypothetical protein